MSNSLSDSRVRRDRSPITRAVVVVPVHNEERLLPSCLAALDVANRVVTARTPAVDVETIVVLDACTDASWRVVSPHVTTLTCSARSVGVARREGFAHSARRERDAGWEETTWFATTDADSEVPPDWLVTHLAAAAEGADAFVGTVVPNGWDNWPTTVADMFADRYVADEGHHHVHGANLGMRADVYRRVGGFSARTGDEDVDIVRRLLSSGARVCRSPRSPVATSTRRDGRTDAGFAHYLRRLEILAGTPADPRKIPENSEVSR
ncbi:glycosyltransferase [Gordonia sp. PKS22-38]|uniref:4,4'-diaponeurosporenoate glycosyltransferase n=1 Tax=Gordonia prachuapensis TaxID=3115651 RepID=A0ABU7MVE5_9ACTN|nr:glycosyltransferase [Gordonia sp. PKS22-38]